MITAADRRRFDERVTFHDKKPFKDWLPTPQQILAWAAIIRAENLRNSRDDAEQHKSRLHFSGKRVKTQDVTRREQTPQHGTSVVRVVRIDSRAILCDLTGCDDG